MDTMARKALSVNEFRKLYGLGRTIIYSLIAENKLHVFKVGRRTLISVKESEEFGIRMEVESNKGGAK